METKFTNKVETCNICYEEILCREYPCCLGKFVCGICMKQMKERDKCPFCIRNIRITRTRTILLPNMITVKHAERLKKIKEFLWLLLFCIVNINLIIAFVLIIKTINDENIELRNFDLVVYIFSLGFYIMFIYSCIPESPRPFFNIDFLFALTIIYYFAIHTSYIIVFYTRTRYMFITSYFGISVFGLILLSIRKGISHLIKKRKKRKQQQENPETNHFLVNNLFIHMLPNNQDSSSSSSSSSDEETSEDSYDEPVIEVIEIT